MRIFSWRLTLVVIAATSLVSYPKAARAMTVDVTIGPGSNLVFSPASVTIHPGDQVRWTWVRAATVQPQAPRDSQTVSGIREFVTKARPSLILSIVPERFRTTAFHTVDAVTWWAQSWW
jgi:plastocyanin